MKQTTILISFFLLSFFSSQAQHVKVRMNFPSGISLTAPGAPPFHGAYWVEPEWKWVGNRYDHVPGYWARPHKKHHKWQRGHWKHTRRGFIWVSGRWR